MRRFSLFVTLLVLGSGCLDQRRAEPNPTDDLQPETLLLHQYLKADYSMRLEPPADGAPRRVAANPMINGFANEQLRPFASLPVPRDMNISRVRVVAYYEVAAPSVDPFPNTTDPTRARQLVFWIGSNGTYPASVSTSGETVLLPGRIHRVETELSLPIPGWIVPAGESLQLLVATLAFNDQGAELYFLVDSAQTPSRVELEGQTDTTPKPTTLFPVAKQLEILGNSGMFTGATAERVPSKIRVPIDVRTNDTYLGIRIIFQSNAGGKSDLDAALLAPNGATAAVSSTPFQSESMRLFAPHLITHGPGTYPLDVTAYSGANTKFRVELDFDSPR